MIATHRPVEDIALARLALDDETERRRQAIIKARKICGDRPAAYFLCHALGMTQREIAELAGVRKQTISYHICNFRKYLRIAYEGVKDA